MATILGSLLGVSIVKAQQVWYDAGIFLTTAEVLLGTEKKKARVCATYAIKLK